MLQFEDDEYYYYVKAVPKMSISEKEVKVKSITFAGEERRMEDIPKDTGAPVEHPEGFSVEEVDFESKLEESLKEL